MYDSIENDHNYTWSVLVPEAFHSCLTNERTQKSSDENLFCIMRFTRSMRVMLESAVNASSSTVPQCAAFVKIVANYKFMFARKASMRFSSTLFRKMCPGELLRYELWLSLMQST